MIVCHCHAVSDRSVRSAVRAGARCIESVTRACGAGGACGGCHQNIVDVIGQESGERSDVDTIALCDWRPAA